ncbi:MAG: hypothetical protein GDA46_02040 [Bdellovibrionales bacterium]|nr:hypothetical protein [Bdellovibrionales bacterium]
MKKNILILSAVSLSFVSISVFARRSQQPQRQLKNQTQLNSQAFSQKPVVEGCKGTCAEAVPRESVKTLNVMEKTPLRNKLLKNLPQIDASVKELIFKEVVSKGELRPGKISTHNEIKIKHESDSYMVPLIRALQTAQQDNWSTEHRNNFESFVKALVKDGINKEEAKKLKEVRDKC